MLIKTVQKTIKHTVQKPDLLYEIVWVILGIVQHEKVEYFTQWECGVMANTSVFQTDDAGSIPVIPSKRRIFLL